jgi:hypothetical protein
MKLTIRTGQEEGCICMMAAVAVVIREEAVAGEYVGTAKVVR